MNQKKHVSAEIHNSNASFILLLRVHAPYYKVKNILTFVFYSNCSMERERESQQQKVKNETNIVLFTFISFKHSYVISAPIDQPATQCLILSVVSVDVRPHMIRS